MSSKIVFFIAYQIKTLIIIFTLKPGEQVACWCCLADPSTRKYIIFKHRNPEIRLNVFFFYKSLL